MNDTNQYDDTIKEDVNENVDNVDKKEKKNNKKWLLLLLLLLFLCLFGYLVFRIGFSVGRSIKPVTPDPTPQKKVIIKISDSDGEWGEGNKQKKVAEIEINPSRLSLEFNESREIFGWTTATDPIRWTSSDESCVTVSPKEGAKPTLTAGNKECTVIITARVGGATAEIVVTVVEKHDELTGIKLSQSNYEVYIGKSTLASVEATPVTAELPKLIYRIEDTTIATVDENGVIRGVSEGKTKLIVTTADGKYKSTATVTVKKNKNKDKVEINPGNLSLEFNESHDIFGTTTSTEPIKWESSDESCVTISPKEGAKPTVTAGNKECTAVITAVSGDSSSEIVVTVVDKHDKLTGIKLSQSDYEVYIGKSTLASVVAVPTTAELPKLIYKIEDPTIATVDENGVIRGVSEGKTKLIVTTADGKYKSTATVTVKDDSNTKDKVEINPGNLSLEFNESHDIFGTTTSTDPIKWESSDESCVTISPKEGAKPTVTAGNKECTAVITAVSGDGKAEIVVTVVEKHDKLTGIKLDQSDYEVYIGKSTLASVVAVPTTAELPKLIYKIENPTIATVDENGVIRGVSEGKTRLIVTTADGKYKSTATVTVKDDSNTKDKVEINPGNLSLEFNESHDIFGTTTSTDPIKWESSDESCVTVSPKEGVKPTVTAGNKECTAVITAKSGDGKAEIVVTVVDKHDNLNGIKLDQSNYEVYIGKSTLASVVAVPTTAELPKLVYRMEDPTIATVDENGVIKGVSEGTTKLIVTTADGKYSSTATVTVKKEPSTPGEEVNEINVFRITNSSHEYVAPYDRGVYEFDVKNTINNDIVYKLSLEEENADRVNIKYKLKKNGVYIFGAQGWVTYDKVKLEDVSLSAKATDNFELEWSWVSENNELDTQIGLKPERAEYILRIVVLAQEIEG